MTTSEITITNTDLNPDYELGKEVGRISMLLYLIENKQVNLSILDGNRFFFFIEDSVKNSEYYVQKKQEYIQGKITIRIR